MEGVLLDLDQTLVDSRSAAVYRSKGNWSKVKELIPTFLLYDGVQELLDALRAAEFRLAIVTSAPSMYAEKVIENFGWDPDSVVAYHDRR